MAAFPLRIATLLPLLLCLVDLADAAPLDDWRREVAQARQLADNNPRAAYRDAQRLAAALSAEAAPADRARIANVLARVEIYLALTDEAWRDAELAFEIARQGDDKVGQIEADMTKALIAVNQGRLEDLAAVTTHSMTLVEDIDRPDLLAEALLRTGTMYGRAGAFDASMVMPMQAMDIAKRSRNDIAMVYAHEGMAIALLQVRRWAEVEDHYVQMREHARAAHSGIFEAMATLGIGNALTEQNKPGAAEPLIREALEFFRRFDGPFYVAHGLYALAHNLKRQGRAAEALALLDEVVAIHEKRGNRIGLWWAYFGRSGYYLAAGRIADSTKDAQRAYDISKTIGSAYYQSRSARQLAGLAAARGEHERAYALSSEAAELTEKADRERADTRMVDLAQRYRTEAKQHEIDTLTRDADRQAIQTRWLLTVLGGSVALLAVTAFFYMRQRRSHALLAAANRQLHDAQQDIRTINASLEQRVQERTGELRQQERYLRTLIDMLPMWAWFKDTDSRYLVTNQAHAQAYGSTPETMVGKTDLDLTPREQALSHHADDVEVMNSRERKSVEEHFADASGTRWMETYKAAVVDEDGTVLGTVGVARDISERKAVEEARDAALTEARRLAKARSDFLAHMSHELRTPLNGVLGYTQIMRRDDRLDERQRRALAVIQESGEQLLTLINDILDFAKVESGRVEVTPVDIMLQRFLRTFIDVIGVRAEQKGLVFLCDLAPDLPDAILADERLLRQLLLNLLSNAVKYTERGRIVLRVAFQPPGHLRFAVEDTGVGIAADQLEKVFEPFEQVGDGRQRFGGTGLGLAISREFARRMGSDIHVESRLGAGSTFWFEIDVPVVCAAPTPAPPEGVVVGYAGPRRRVLIVDDMVEARLLLEGLLEPLGFETAQAANGREAIELARTLNPDLILMDCIMPEMNGYEAMARLRELPGFEKLPIIAISASASCDDREITMDKGASAFLSKPVEFKSLLDEIGTLLQVEWQYETRTVDVPSQGAEVFVPPAEDMERLLHHARQGSMRDIVQHAAALAERDDRYRVFAEQLRKLAMEYQSKAILQLVNRFWKQEPVSDG